MLIDVGTMPLARSLFLLYEAMETQKDLAGCCGEIRPMDPNIWKLVVPAQVVEYRFSHIFDKALESVLGYITVLPGAFSAYRWEALQGDPLWKDYFKSICHPELMSAFNSNIYLAEDRVLCLSLISKKKSSYLIRYVRDSVSETDVPENISSLMAQRRRWINGSWFSLIDSIQKCPLIYQSGHNCCRKCIFSAQMFYYVVNIIFSWVMVGSFFVVFSILIKVVIGENESSKVISGSSIVILIYFLLLLFVLVMSLGVRPNRVEGMYKIIACVFGIYMMVSFICAIVFVATQTYQSIVMYAVLSSFAMFGITVVLTCSVMTTLKGVFHYLFLTPTYVNVFLIYSICNTHDCTWGNRPDLLSQEEKNRIEEFEEFRIRWVIVWVLCNCSFAFLLNSLGNVENGQWYVYGVGVFGMSIMVFRFIGSILYIFQEACCKRKMKQQKRVAPVVGVESQDKVKAVRSSERVMTQPYTLLDEHPKDSTQFMIRRKLSIGSDVNKPFQSQEVIKDGVKLNEIHSLEMMVKTISSHEKQNQAKFAELGSLDLMNSSENQRNKGKVEKIVSLAISRGSKFDTLNLVDQVLNEERTEEISELSLVLRQKRFQKGIRLTQMSSDVGISVNRLRGIEEGTMIPTQEERKILSYYIINYKE
jgi:cellulose synthase/poly-beta-1,6-N-acetylglucosamine synthase-like glycosyltransferase